MKVNELNITITKALVTEIHLELGEDGLNLYVKGTLMTKSGRKVSDFSFSSNFYGEGKIEIPPTIHPFAREIFEQMTPVIYKKIGESFKALPKGGGENET